MFNKGDKVYASNTNQNPTEDNIQCQFLNKSEANGRFSLCVLENGDVEGFKFINRAECECEADEEIPERSIDLEQIMNVLETAKVNAYKLDSILDAVDEDNIEEIYLNQVDEINALIEAFLP